MPLVAGSRLGDYEIVAPLGAGGMGEVYRASDLQLGREVAIKVLPRPDPQTMARFEREARAVAALSHPNILEIHQFGRDAGTQYLVTELLEGDTLRRRIVPGPMPWRGAAAIAAQVCDGLAAAHAKSIIHRDLKPENIFLTSDGRAKILDFGLARIEPVATPTELEPTDLRTATGTVMGTLTYMSPEQLRGEQVDSATDLFALGCILHEMISGRAPFARASVSETGSAILRDEPPPLEGIPAELRDLVSHCLAKDKGHRLQSARDLGFTLRRLIERDTQQPKPRRGTAAAIGLAVLATAAGAWYLIERQQTPAATVTETPRGEKTLTQISFAKSVEQFPAWSPDASRVVFSRETGAPRKLFLRTLADSSERQLTRGEADDIHPAWSPDGKTILFVRSNRPGQRVNQTDVYAEYDDADIWSIEVETGNERQLIRDAYDPAWSVDGSRIAFDAPWSGSHRIWVTDRLGRNPQQVTTDTSEAVEHIRPRWSPDSSRIVFQNMDRTQFDIRVVDLATKTHHAITDDHTLDLNPVWSPSGESIYFSSYRGGGINVWRARVDAAGRQTTPPQQVTTGAGHDLDLAISANGKRLAMATLRQNSDLWRLPVTLGGLTSGAPLELVATTREETRGSWARDGTAIAFSSDRTGDMNLWVRTLGEQADRQITRGPGGDFQADWSPDGTRLVFFSGRADTIDIWDVDLRNGALRRLSKDGATNTHPFYSPDGSQIAYMSDSGGRLEAWIMNADGTGSRQVSRSGISVHFIRWSPDGSMISFRSLAGPGLVTMPAGGGTEQRIEGVVDGGYHHSFSPDRSRIIDVRNHRTLFVYPVSSGEPRRLFEFEDPQVRIDYPVWSPDGRWVLFDRSRPEGGDIWMLEGFE